MIYAYMYMFFMFVFFAKWKLNKKAKIIVWQSVCILVIIRYVLEMSVSKYVAYKYTCIYIYAVCYIRYIYR